MPVSKASPNSPPWPAQAVGQPPPRMVHLHLRARIGHLVRQLLRRALAPRRTTRNPGTCPPDVFGPARQRPPPAGTRPVAPALRLRRRGTSPGPRHRPPLFSRPLRPRLLSQPRRHRSPTPPKTSIPSPTRRRPQQPAPPLHASPWNTKPPPTASPIPTTRILAKSAQHGNSADGGNIARCSPRAYRKIHTAGLAPTFRFPPPSFCPRIRPTFEPSFPGENHVRHLYPLASRSNPHPPHL